MKNKNLEVLYEDSHIIVCVKPHGIPTQSRQIGSPDMVSILKNHISCNTSSPDPYLAVIHRLDQPVRGILVFAKTPSAARELNKQLTQYGFGKHYRALVNGKLPQNEGVLENYLVKDSRSNTSRVCTESTPGAKFARLQYKIVKKGQGNLNLGRGISQFPPSPINSNLSLTGLWSLYAKSVSIFSATARTLSDTRNPSTTVVKFTPFV